MSNRSLQPQVIQAFGTPIIVFDVPDPESINAILRGRILERRSTDQGVVRSNVGNWHSAEDFAEWGSRGAQVLAQTFGGICSGLTEVPQSGPNGLRWVVRMWANVSERGAFNRQHCHPGAYWSGVYYVSDGRSIPDEEVGGELVLHSPHETVSSMYAPDVHIRLPDGPRLSPTMTIRPRPGLGVVFPSWIVHEVDPYYGEGIRISVALNFSLAGRSTEASG
jgi:uncharacterized protein (TIGR02466 family)